jgi:hypothetical protein
MRSRSLWLLLATFSLLVLAAVACGNLELGVKFEEEDPQADQTAEAQQVQDRRDDVDAQRAQDDRDARLRDPSDDDSGRDDFGDDERRGDFGPSRYEEEISRIFGANDGLDGDFDDLLVKIGDLGDLGDLLSGGAGEVLSTAIDIATGIVDRRVDMVDRWLEIEPPPEFERFHDIALRGFDLSLESAVNLEDSIRAFLEDGDPRLLFEAEFSHLLGEAKDAFFDAQEEFQRLGAGPQSGRDGPEFRDDGEFRDGPDFRDEADGRNFGFDLDRYLRDTRELLTESQHRLDECSRDRDLDCSFRIIIHVVDGLGPPPDDRQMFDIHLALVDRARDMEDLFRRALDFNEQPNGPRADDIRQQYARVRDRWLQAADELQGFGRDDFGDDFGDPEGGFEDGEFDRDHEGEFGDDEFDKDLDEPFDEELEELTDEAPEHEDGPEHEDDLASKDALAAEYCDVTASITGHGDGQREADEAEYRALAAEVLIGLVSGDTDLPLARLGELADALAASWQEQIDDWATVQPLPGAEDAHATMAEAYELMRTVWADERATVDAIAASDDLLAGATLLAQRQKDSDELEGKANDLLASAGYPCG